MDKNNESFEKRLLATFRDEADEHLRALSAGLIALEQVAGDGRRQELVEGVFRETHSLKGAARAVGKMEIETLCQAMESVLSRLKRNVADLTVPMLDLLHDTVETLGRLLADLDRPPSAAHQTAARELRRRLSASAESGGPAAAATMAAGGAGGAVVAETETIMPAADKPVAPAISLPPARNPPAAAGSERPAASGAGLPQAVTGNPPVEPAPDPAPAEALLLRPTETVRVPVSRLDAILFQSESLLSAKLTARQRADDLRDIHRDFNELVRARARIAPDLRALQRRLERAERQGEARRGDPRLGRLLEFLSHQDEFARHHGLRLVELGKSADHDWRTLWGMVDGLLDHVKMALMLPVASAVEVLPKFIRDGSRSQGKEVDFHAVGLETEIDRRILEELRDPLLHLIRNCLDHGIEEPAMRVAAGKPRRGRIDLQVNQLEGGRIEIEVADDGAGIALDRVREAARRLGVGRGESTEGAAPDDVATLNLIFQSGLSTSPIITDFSGRGLGLAIVREKVERLGGSVTVSSDRGRGTRFCVVLPLTLSTFRGVHVRCGDREFIVPTLHLASVVRVARAAIASVEGRATVTIGGQSVAFVRLAEVLGIAEPPAETDAGSVPLVVAGRADGRIAFQVSDVLGEQEVLVKSLGRQLRRVRNIFGATVLGSGKVLPILHVPDLLKSARLAAAPAPQPPAAAVEGPRSLLVAEDSITSRMLLKGILELAGYRVKTAVDGLDAFTQLRTEPFDLLVSDVDMPRMNGFDLTARVRGDRALTELPVVLVTALDSREDKERGAEVGANAYIVKSSFDQSNLLAAIRRLL